METLELALPGITDFSDKKKPPPPPPPPLSSPPPPPPPPLSSPRPPPPEPPIPPPIGTVKSEAGPLVSIYIPQIPNPEAELVIPKGDSLTPLPPPLPSTPPPPMPSPPPAKPSSRGAVARLVKTGLQKGIEEGAAVHKDALAVAKKVKARIDQGGAVLDRIEASTRKAQRRGMPRKVMMNADRPTASPPMTSAPTAAPATAAPTTSAPTASPTTSPTIHQLVRSGGSLLLVASVLDA